MTKKEKVISFRISNETYDIWKKAISIERQKIKMLFVKEDQEAITFNEAPLIESLMKQWAKKILCDNKM